MKGIISKWIMSLPIACSELLLSYISIQLGGVMYWPRVVPSRKGILQKGRGEAMKFKCINLDKELIALRKEVKVVNSLQELVITHGSPSSFTACVTELTNALKGAEERCDITYGSVKEKVH